jgi:beta-RFAP synthase
MITVQAASRLHFGLFSLAVADFWPNCQGEQLILSRRYASVGLMVEKPGVRIRFESALRWSAEGPLAERALGYVRRWQEAYPQWNLLPRRLVVEQCGPEHVGLGTGTQLAFAVSWGLLSAPLPAHHIPAVETWPAILGRAVRSGVGTHGFFVGGFLVDAGTSAGSSGPAPLIASQAFPQEWCIVLVIPSGVQGLHGSGEREAFDELLAQPSPLATTDALCRLVMLGLLPALVEQDMPAFGEALYDFNRRVGEMFAPVQGGPYAHPQLAEMVTYLRQQGVRGVGQSSWGPTLFAVVWEDQAESLASKVRERFGLSAAEVFVTRAANGGASSSDVPGPGPAPGS